jgi:hypothetical protein
LLLPEVVGLEQGANSFGPIIWIDIAEDRLPRALNGWPRRRTPTFALHPVVHDAAHVFGRGSRYRRGLVPPGRKRIRPEERPGSGNRAAASQLRLIDAVAGRGMRALLYGRVAPCEEILG